MRSELDFLCVMLHDFLSLGANSTTYYARLSPAAAAAATPPPRNPLGASAADPRGPAADAGGGGGGGGGGGERRAFLARVTTAKMFDAAGRLWQVHVWHGPAQWVGAGCGGPRGGSLAGPAYDSAAAAAARAAVSRDGLTGGPACRPPRHGGAVAGGLRRMARGGGEQC